MCAQNVGVILAGNQTSRHTRGHTQGLNLTCAWSVGSALVCEVKPQQTPEVTHRGEDI